MAVDFKTFLSIVPHIVNARYPVLLRGRHGIGKSTVVYQLAKERGLPVVERRASQMTEGDLLGLPKVEGKVTTWLAPEWLHKACNEPCLLFLDEVDRATLEVRQGIFELCDSRKIAGSTLHPDTLIFAAVNGGDHGAQYQVGEMDPAELDRYTVFDVEPSVEDWLNWAEGKVAVYLWDFINNNHGHLEHKDEFEPNKKYPSRRSWVRLSSLHNAPDTPDRGPLRARCGVRARADPRRRAGARRAAPRAPRRACEQRREGRWGEVKWKVSFFMASKTLHRKGCTRVRSFVWDRISSSSSFERK